MVEPLAAANLIITTAKEEKKELTNLKLQKILFFIQGFYLNKHDKPFIDGKFSKWKYGPVQIEVYNYLKDYGPSKITETIKVLSAKDENGSLSLDEPKINEKELQDDIINFIKIILNKDAWELVGYTHNHQSWKNFESNISNYENLVYSNEEIKSCYLENKNNLEG